MDARFKPRLTVGLILAWADDHHDRTGRWPAAGSGPVLAGDAPDGESWLRIDAALRLGLRGLPGGDSLSRLLARERGRRRAWDRPLTEERVRGWVLDHRARTGSWPTRDNGPVLAEPGETWSRVYVALWGGLRGLAGGQTLLALAKQLAEEAGEGFARDPRGSKPSAERRAEAARLRAQGLTLKEIGERMGCSKQNVAGLLRPPKTPQPPGDDP